RFAMNYADEVILSQTNENEYISFAGNRKSEALQDRIILVKVPYNLRVSDEVRIYEKLLRQSNLRGVHVAPHTLQTAATFAVLSRLEESKKAGMSLTKKLKLYDGDTVDGFTPKDVRELRDEAVREGVIGARTDFCATASACPKARWQCSRVSLTPSLPELSATRACRRINTQRIFCLECGAA
ncbi:MAG: hypothetical protein ICV68_00535, partial [Pyrinomonadaceae bacterium]|nr:hypothetical protein [Pyrinomonadaceae bacterium]